MAWEAGLEASAGSAEGADGIKDAIAEGTAINPEATAAADYEVRSARKPPRKGFGGRGHTSLSSPRVLRTLMFDEEVPELLSDSGAGVAVICPSW